MSSTKGSLATNQSPPDDRALWDSFGFRERGPEISAGSFKEFFTAPVALCLMPRASRSVRLGDDRAAIQPRIMASRRFAPTMISVATIGANLNPNSCHALASARTAIRNMAATSARATRTPCRISIRLIRRISASAAICARLVARIAAPHAASQVTHLPAQQQRDKWSFGGSPANPGQQIAARRPHHAHDVG